MKLISFTTLLAREIDHFEPTRRYDVSISSALVAVILSLAAIVCLRQR